MTNDEIKLLKVQLAEARELARIYQERRHLAELRLERLAFVRGFAWGLIAVILYYNLK